MKRGKRIKLGDHWVTDDRTGFAHYASQMTKQWDGLLVKKGSEETRHPQEWVRPLSDPYPVHFLRPEQGTDFDDVCGFYQMEFVPNTVIRRSLSITDDLLPLPGIGQMSLGVAANECGHWFVVQEGVPAVAVFPIVAANNTSSNGPNTTHTISLPDGVATGNRIIVCIAYENEVISTLPNGWAQTFNDEFSGGTLLIFYRDIDGTEGFTGTDDSITVTGDIAESSSHISYRITNFDVNTAPETTMGNIGSSTSPDPDNITPIQGNQDYLVIAVEAHNTGSTDTTGFPSGYTNNQESDSR